MGLLKYKLLFALLGIVIAIFSSSGYGHPSAQHQITFCYENKELFPHYLSHGLAVPEHKPGAAIEIIQQLDQRLANTSFSYVRTPWKRCLQQLKLGKVDAVIARFTESRQQFASFPLTPAGAVDTALAFSKTASCFIHHRELDFYWDGKRLEYDFDNGIIAPSGYSVVDDLTELGFDVYQASTVELAHRLLFSDKFKLSLGNCQQASLPKNYIENPTPVSQEYGYLAFSQSFYSSHPNLAKSIWNELQQIDKKAIYKRYISNN